LLAVPAVRGVRGRFGSVTLAAHAGAARLLAGLGEVDRGLAFDDPSLSWVFQGQAPAEPTVAWMSAPLPGALLVAPGRPPAGAVVHCATYLLGTLAPLGIPAEVDARPLRVAPLASDEVLVHPGSGSMAKNWPAERFAALIRALDAPVRLIVGEADAQAAKAVEAALGERLPRLEQPPLAELAARLAGCRAYVGNDSGVSHLAGLCGARSVVLFGPTDPRVWRPLGPRVCVQPFSATTDVLRTCLTDGC
jgi:hypothetical protein